MKKVFKMFFSPMVLVAMFAMFSGTPEVNAQAAPLTIVNTQPCAVWAGGGAVDPFTCVGCPGGTILAVPGPIPAFGVGTVFACGPATWAWQYVKFAPAAGGPTGGSNSPFGPCPIGGLPVFSTCGFGAPPFTGIWLTPNLVIL